MSTLLLVGFAGERGIGPDTVLAGTGTSMADLESPEATSTAALETRAIHNAVRAGIGADAGLLLGRRFHVTTFGLWGFALVSAATLREAIDVAVRFIELTSALTAPRLDLVDGDLEIVYHDPPYPPDVARFMVQRDLSVMQSLLTEVIGQHARAQRVSFTHQPPAGTEDLYRSVFGVEPEFGARRNAAVFDPVLLAERPPQADAHTTARAQAECRRLLEEHRSRVGLAGQVRDLVLADLRHPPSAADLALTLNLSERTLRRRLAAEGATVRGLVDEVRSTLAAEFVRSGLTVAEIATQLGYLEVSSFSQAFRRWHGMSAREFRAAAR